MWYYAPRSQLSFNFQGLPMQYLPFRALTGLFSLVFCTAISAQTPAENAAAIDPTGSWIFTLGVEQFSFDQEQATVEYIDDSAVGLDIEAEYFFHQRYSVSFGVSFIPYDDNAGFSQETEDNFGDRDTSSSDASGVPLYGELGYKHFFGPQGKTYVTARAGLSAMLSSERSISSCSNCYEEDIDIEGGFYGVLGAGVRLGSSWLLGLQYRNYFSGDFSRGVGATLSYTTF